MRLPPLLPFILLAATAGAQTVYTESFTSGAGPEWSNPATSVANGERFLAVRPTGFGRGTDTLSLAGLPAHNTLTVTFDLYIINSWDGNDQNDIPDAWGTSLDGTSRFLTTFTN